MATKFREKRRHLLENPHELPDNPPVEVWWWEASEAERQFAASLSAGAAARFEDPERLFAFWRRDASTDAQRRYIEDLIARVLRHLRERTGARVVE